jgi:hypothetical protein
VCHENVPFLTFCKSQIEPDQTRENRLNVLILHSRMLGVYSEGVKRPESAC